MQIVLTADEQIRISGKNLSGKIKVTRSSDRLWRVFESDKTDGVIRFLGIDDYQANLHKMTGHRIFAPTRLIFELAFFHVLHLLG